MTSVIQLSTSASSIARHSASSIARHSASASVTLGCLSHICMTDLWWLFFEEDVGPFIVIPRYMFQGCFAEADDAVFSRVVVPLQQRLFNFELAIDLADHHLGVPFACNFVCSHVVS